MKSFFGFTVDEFSRGSLSIDTSWVSIVVVAVAFAILIALITGFRKIPGARVTALIRSALLACLTLALLAPELVTERETRVPGETFVVVDGSKSMNIGEGGQTRASRAIAALAGDDLLENNKVRIFQAGSDLKEIDSPESLRFDANQSRLVEALLELSQSTSGAAPDSIVLVSDGADTSSERIDTALAQIRSAGIKVNVLSTNASVQPVDVSVRSVQIARRLFPGDTAQAEVEIVRTPDAPAVLRLDVLDGASLIHSAEVQFADDLQQRVQIPVELTESGYRQLTFSIPEQVSETILSNNRHDVTVNVSEAPLNVLHFEGEPRFEVKFFRRAVQDENFIRLRSLIRTADNKYLRVGVVDAKELERGFPDTEQQLFRYDVLVLGSANADLLGEQEQQLIQDFVATRGGGLLLLGSRNSFAEGAFSGSVLADVMPVRLDDKAREFRELVSVKPASGNANPLIQLQADAWERLPKLTVVNPIKTVKPGATIELEGTTDDGEAMVVLATQRYGRGRVAALAVRNTWRWQMHPDAGPEDLSHETLMRQLVHWLGRDVPARRRLNVSRHRVARGESVDVTLSARDDVTNDPASAEPKQALRLEVTTPDGNVIRPPWTASTEGASGAQLKLSPKQVGRYDLRAINVDDEVIASSWIQSTENGNELGQPFGHDSFLKNLATASGGRFFTADDADGLKTAVESNFTTARVTQSVALWTTPFAMLLILGLAVAEYLVRKSRGLS